MNNHQNIKDIRKAWNVRLNYLIEREEYESCKRIKDLIDKIDTFIKMKDTVEDMAFYEQMEELVVERLMEFCQTR